jgi:hypothetical protein
MAVMAQIQQHAIQPQAYQAQQQQQLFPPPPPVNNIHRQPLPQFVSPSLVSNNNNDHHQQEQPANQQPVAHSAFNPSVFLPQDAGDMSHGQHFIDGHAVYNLLPRAPPPQDDPSPVVPLQPQQAQLEGNREEGDNGMGDVDGGGSSLANSGEHNEEHDEQEANGGQFPAMERTMLFLAGEVGEEAVLQPEVDAPAAAAASTTAADEGEGEQVQMAIDGNGDDNSNGNLEFENYIDFSGSSNLDGHGNANNANDENVNANGMPPLPGYSPPHGDGDSHGDHTAAAATTAAAVDADADDYGVLQLLLYAPPPSPPNPFRDPLQVDVMLGGNVEDALVGDGDADGEVMLPVAANGGAAGALLGDEQGLGLGMAVPADRDWYAGLEGDGVINWGD